MKHNITFYVSCAEDVKKYNPLYSSLGQENVMRQEFFEDFILNNEIVEKYVNKLGFSWKQRIIRRIPWNIKYYAKKIIRKLRNNGSK